MAQGAQGDLLDIRYYAESTTVIFNRSNEPIEDINNNTLTVDNKAIAARDLALSVSTTLAAHIGQQGPSEHADVTDSVAGFMPPVTKAKLDNIQAGAQINILAPVDALELVSRKVTTLHLHPPATTTTPGFLTAGDKGKLDGIEAGAQVNNISTANVTTLTTGGNADALHTHTFAAGSETFTAAVHATTNHTGLPGIPVFPGFAPSAFVVSSTQIGPGITVFSHNHGGTFTTLDAIVGGFQSIHDGSLWGLNEEFSINDVNISGTTGTITFEILAGAGFGDMEATCWQVGYGVV